MIGVITDSSCNLPEDLIRELDIAIVPLNVHIGDETYEETSISTVEICRRMREEDVLPKTSQPAPGKFLEAYKQMLGKGYDSLIVITITSVHSGTYGTALMAKNMLPEADIEVVDSRSISLGTGFQAEVAARLARAGKSKEEILAAIRKVRESTYIYATAETLHYLYKGGRVSAVKMLMASMLNIKPILVVRDGEVTVGGTTRTRSRSLKELLKRTYKALDGYDQVDVAVIHADCLDDALMLKSELEENLPCRELFLLDVTAVLAVHGGPGLIGIVSRPADVV